MADEASTISAATHRHNNGYNTAVEHQHAGGNSRGDLKVALRRGIGVHIEFVRFSKCAQIPLAVGVNQSDLTSQTSILNTVDNKDIRHRQIEYAQYGGFNGIGRNDLAIAFDHNIAAITIPSSSRRVMQPMSATESSASVMRAV